MVGFDDFRAINHDDVLTISITPETYDNFVIPTIQNVLKFEVPILPTHDTQRERYGSFVIGIDVA